MPHGFRFRFSFMASHNTSPRRDGFFRLLARGLALFLALYVALSIFALFRDNAYNLNTWWIDLHFLPALVGAALQAIVALALFVFALFSPARPVLKLPVGIVFLLFAALAGINATEVYLTAASGVIVLGFPVPFSLFIAVAFLLLALATLSKRSADPGRKQGRANGGSGLKTVSVMLLSVVLSGILFPLGQVYCFGKTEYRSRVDAVVVLGAQVLPNGQLTYPLQDRVDKGIRLYRDGLTPVLIMSGGVDVEGTDEAAAMRDYAVKQGVPASAILLDSEGNTTEATAQNVVKIAEQKGFIRLGAVSSYYHMARIKMLFLANGHDVYTYPATPNLEGSNLAFNTIREIPGWWYYWFDAVFA
ncbi:MAG TPA: hypothetical protein DEB24_05225 [Coriobacteriia bacterium]|nr:hypothetical protein [Coriobacteriia bacterium]